MELNMKSILNQTKK